MVNKETHYSFKRISKEHEQRGCLADNIEDAMEQAKRTEGQLECGYLGRIAESLEQIQCMLMVVCMPMAMQARDARREFVTLYRRAWQQWLEQEETLHGKCPSIVVHSLERGFYNHLIAPRLGRLQFRSPWALDHSKNDSFLMWNIPDRSALTDGWAKHNGYPRLACFGKSKSKTRHEYDKWRKRKAKKKSQPHVA